MLCDWDVLERLLCHWESGVRHLMLTFISYRLFGPDQLRVQVSLLTKLRTSLACFSRELLSDLALTGKLVDEPRLEHPKLAVVTLLEGTNNPAITVLVQEQCDMIMKFVAVLTEGHTCAEPPYTLATMVPMDSKERWVKRTRASATDVLLLLY